MRKTKWWLAEFLFVWETSIINAYLLMKNFHLAMGLKPKWTHWEFHEEIAWALLDQNGPPMRKTPTNRQSISGLSIHGQQGQRDDG